MEYFDNYHVAEWVERLSTLKPDTKPAWGALTPRAMVAHLAETMRYSMGRRGSVPFRGNWFTRRVLGPLVLNGLVGLPDRLEVLTPEPVGEPESVHDDLETLHAVLEDYLNLVQADELETAMHPYFGPIGVDGWAKAHTVHFEHHMRQFGV